VGQFRRVITVVAVAVVVGGCAQRPAGSGRAEQLAIRTHAASVSVANPTIESIRIGGHEALLVTVYLFSEGAQGEEDGPLLYYRTLSGADASRSVPSDL
jgi:hypothetical protein